MHTRSAALGVIISLTACGTGTTAAGDEDPLYFPPKDGAWERVQPADVGWDAKAIQQALAFSGDHNSSGVVILHRGRILAERQWQLDDPPAVSGMTYRQVWFHGTTGDGWAIEDVASTQKSVISVLAGIAADKGLLDIEDPVSKYLGKGWSAAPPEAEAKVLVRHLLSMSAGLSETKMELVAPAGERWAYINKAYSLVNEVVQAATGREPNDFMSDWLTGPLGTSDTRWIVRAEIFRQWNMNGLATTAPDLVAALGSCDRKVYVVPSLGLVVSRTGSSAKMGDDGMPVQQFFDHGFWRLLIGGAPD